MFGPSHPNNGLSIKNRSGLRYCDVPLPRMQARKPPGMVLKPVVNNGINYHINWLAGFLPSTVSPVHPIYSARLPQPVNKFQERHHKVFVVGLPQESSPRSNLCVYSIYIILYIIYVYYVYIYIYFKQKTLHISSGIYIYTIYIYYWRFINNASRNSSMFDQVSPTDRAEAPAPKVARGTWQRQTAGYTPLKSNELIPKIAMLKARDTC